ncbi:MAG: hypothetical protein C4523_17035 [Myxococcales bacterium]|nr:MAG: hypothetical protein C4523_17035 [Myxococcales bacterium]
MEDLRGLGPAIAAPDDNPFKTIDFRRYVWALVRAWKRMVFVVLLFGAIGVAWAMEIRGTTYTAAAVILRTDPPRKIVISEGQHFDLPQVSLDTLMDILRVPSNLQKIIERAGLDTDVHDFMGKIKLSRPVNSNMISVSAVGDSPNQAVQIANIAAEVFVEFLETMRREDAKKAFEELDSLVEDANAKLKAVTDERAEFKQQHGIVSLDMETEVSLEKVSELRLRAEEARSQLSGLSRQLSQYGSTPDAPMDMSEAETSRAELAALKRQYDDLKMRYTDENPQVDRLRKRIAELESKVAVSQKGTISGQRDVVAARINSLNSQRAQLEKKLSSMSEKERGFADIQQRYIFAKRLADSLMIRREEASSFANEGQQEFRIIERAFPPKYPESSAAKIVAVGVPVLAFFLGFFVVLLREILNPALRSAREVHQRAGLAVLGQQFHDPKAPKNAPHVEPDVYKPIVAALSVEKRFSERQVIGFFATVKGSGLTTVCESFARAWAARGRRTLIVDLDLHYDTPSGPTLREVFENRATLDELIRKGEDGAPDRLAGGLSSHEDLDLFCRPEFLNFVADLRARYELIVLDTPPLYAYLQAIELAPVVDGGVLVVRSGRTKKDHFERMIRLLQNLNKPLVGAFIADAEPFFARQQEIAAASLYRKAPVGRGWIETFILKKLMT